MSAQDLEQQARDLLAAEYERDGKAGSAEHIRTRPLLPNKDRAVRAIVSALRQQPAPAIIDNAGKVEPACEVRLWDSQWVNIVNAPEVLDASDREEAINTAVRMTERAIAQNVASSNLPPAPHQPAPVVDDAMRELIEADKEYDAIRQRAQRYPCPGMDEHVMAVRKRRAAALARAQGVQS